MLVSPLNVAAQTESKKASSEFANRNNRGSGDRDNLKFSANIKSANMKSPNIKELNELRDSKKFQNALENELKAKPKETLKPREPMSSETLRALRNSKSRFENESSIDVANKVERESQRGFEKNQPKTTPDDNTEKIENQVNSALVDPALLLYWFQNSQKTKVEGSSQPSILEENIVFELNSKILPLNHQKNSLVPDFLSDSIMSNRLESAKNSSKFSQNEEFHTEEFPVEELSKSHPQFLTGVNSLQKLPFEMFAIQNTNFLNSPSTSDFVSQSKNLNSNGVLTASTLISKSDFPFNGNLETELPIHSKLFGDMEVQIEVFANETSMPNSEVFKFFERKTLEDFPQERNSNFGLNASNNTNSFAESTLSNKFEVGSVSDSFVEPQNKVLGEVQLIAKSSPEGKEIKKNLQVNLSEFSSAHETNAAQTSLANQTAQGLKIDNSSNNNSQVSFNPKSLQAEIRSWRNESKEDREARDKDEMGTLSELFSSQSETFGALSQSELNGKSALIAERNSAQVSEGSKIGNQDSKLQSSIQSSVQSSVENSIDKVYQASAGRMGVAKIKLQDAQLGQIELNVKMNGGNKIQISVNATNEGVANSLAGSEEKISAALKGKNIQLESFTVENSVSVSEAQKSQNTVNAAESQKSTEFSNQQNGQNESRNEGRNEGRNSNNGSENLFGHWQQSGTGGSGYGSSRQEQQSNGQSADFLNSRRLSNGTKGQFANNSQENSSAWNRQTQVQRSANGALKVRA